MSDPFPFLRMWRAKKAAQEGVEPFRILTNAALEDIARRMPETAEGLMEVKGVKDAKCRKYGREILEIVARSRGGALPGPSPVLPAESEDEPPRSGSQASEDGDPLLSVSDETLSVSRFLDGVNLELSGMAARIRGEVSSVDERERVVYFSLKDPEDGSLLSCLIFRFQYDASGIRLREGDEIIVEGVPEIWKPMGKFSLKAGVIEYAGEGALKKAYDELYRKLESEGVFAPERKRALPDFPERIALITSEQGAAIGDFLMNVGNLGIRIDLYPSSVEGKRAVIELLRAIRIVRRRATRYDLLVVVRGGGSIESLQAFNTEALVREIDDCEIPVIAGIGHEKDVTLSALAADVMVSTPTAAARAIREPFERARQALDHHERTILSSYGETLSSAAGRIEESVSTFFGFLEGVSDRFERAASALRSAFGVLSYRIRSDSERIDRLSSGVTGCFRSATRTTRDRIDRLGSALRTYDPNRVLSLGYGLIRAANGTLLRKSTDARVGDRLDIRLSEGRIGAEVKEVE